MAMNWRGAQAYARRLRLPQMDKRLILIGALLVMQGLDIATTAFGLRIGLREVNGLAAGMMATHGEFSAYFFKAVATFSILICILLLERRYARLWLAVKVATVYMFLVVAFNLVNIALEA